MVSNARDALQRSKTKSMSSDVEAPTLTRTVPGELRVLLVEDDDADAYLIERALSENPRVGTVLRARDGVEALEIVDSRQFEPDLAIVDLHMPRKDGFSLLSELGARVTAEFPAIVFTSARSGADALRSKKRGAAHYLTKPHRTSQMSEALDRVLADFSPASDAA